MNLLAQAQTDGLRTTIDSLARTPLSQVVWFVLALTVVRIVLFPVLRNTVPHKRTGGYKFARFVNELMDAFIYAGVFVFMLIRPFALQTFVIPSGSMIPTLLVNDMIVANKWVYRVSDPKVGDIVVFRPPVTAAEKSQIGPDGTVSVDFIKRCLGVPGEVVEVRDGQLYRNGKPDPDPWRHFSLSPNSPAGVTRDGDRMDDFKFVKYDGPFEPWKGKTIPVAYGRASSWPNFGYGVPLAKEFCVGLAFSDSPMPYPSPGDAFKDESELNAEERERLRYLKEAPAAPIPPGHYLMIGDNRNGSFDSRGWGLVPREQIVGKSEAIWMPISRWRSTR